MEAIEQRKVSFKATQKEQAYIGLIVERAAKFAKEHGRSFDWLSCAMDLRATNANGCKLDFAKLASFDDFNLAHDVFGIERHLDRSTGFLTDCFLPRAARGEA